MSKFRLKLVGVVASTLIWAFGHPAFPQTLTPNPECKKVAGFGENNKELQSKLNETKIGDKAVWCPIKARMIANNDEMIRIFELDTERCGVRDSIVDRLKAATEASAVDDGSLWSERLRKTPDGRDWPAHCASCRAGPGPCLHGIGSGLTSEAAQTSAMAECPSKRCRVVITYGPGQCLTSCSGRGKSFGTTRFSALGRKIACWRIAEGRYKM